MFNATWADTFLYVALRYKKRDNKTVFGARGGVFWGDNRPKWLVERLTLPTPDLSEHSYMC